jgi:Large ribosomal RNA subunit accumulation protein YceD
MRAREERALDRPWSMPVSIHEIPETGRHVELAADEAVRAAVAGAAGLEALPRLEATFDVTRRGANGLRVTGRVSATVGQICVVTLDPIENEIEEMVDLDFVPAAGPDIESSSGQGHSVEVTVEEAPELLFGDTVDLGALATEFLMLGIDPYPRKPGAVFVAETPEDEMDHPFAALAGLRREKGGNGQ